jgi:predicted PurR-regulated permease PerM
LVIIVSAALYLAADPSTYVDGLVRLVPPRARDRARDLLRQVHDVLLWWLIGKVASMCAVGVLTYLGLKALGVPLALMLALIASILTFMPNIGPILAAVPAVLLALEGGLASAGWVLGLYLAVQTVESYILTPMIQQKAVSLPPALILAAQIIAGVLAGIPGVAMATPLTAAAVVLVRKLYVEDILERRAAD